MWVSSTGYVKYIYLKEFKLFFLFFSDSEWGRKYLAQSDINEELSRQINLMKVKMTQLSEIEPSDTGIILSSILFCKQCFL